MNQFHILHIVIIGLLLSACSEGFKTDRTEQPAESQNNCRGEDQFLFDGECLTGPSVPAKVWLENPIADHRDKDIHWSSNLENFGSTVRLPASNNGTIEAHPLFVVDTSYLGEQDRQIFFPNENDPDFIPAISFFPDLVFDAFPHLEYTPVEPEFQMVNTHYHLLRIIKRLERNGADLESMTPLKVISHCSLEDARNNAFFAVGGGDNPNIICMGFSEVNVDIDGDGSTELNKYWSADDSDVIIHEFGHSVVNHYITDANQLNSFNEGLAMNESLADYFAETQNDNYELSEWYSQPLRSFGFMLPDSTEDVFLRNASLEPESYPSAIKGEGHADSIYFSNIWHHTFTEILDGDDKKKRADTLLLKSLQDLGPYPLFGDMINNLMFHLEESEEDAESLKEKANSIGLLRKENLNEIEMGDLYIVDDNYLFNAGISSGTNCNGILDEGETILLLIDLENTGLEKGHIKINYSIDDGETLLSVLDGGHIGAYHRLPASTNSENGKFSQISPTQEHWVATAAAITAEAGSAGQTVNLNVTIEGMNTIDGQLNARDFDISIEIGNAELGTGDCTDPGLWP